MNAKQKIFDVIKKVLIYVLPVIGIYNTFHLNQNKYSSFPLLMIFLLLIFLYKRVSEFKFDKTEKIGLTIVSIIISTFIVIGTTLDFNYNYYEYSIFTDISLILLEIYSMTVFIGMLISLLYKTLEKYIKQSQIIKKRKYTFLITFLIIMAVWSIYLVNYYPGLMSPDSLNQWGQATGSLELSNHHPIAHTLIIKIFTTIGDLVNNNNIGVMLYNVFQMSILAMVFAYLILFMIDKKSNKYLIIGTLLFYTVIPVFGIYSVTMWKDILFGAGTLLLMIQMYKFISDKVYKKIDILLLIISIIWVCLFRTNGLYAVILLDILLVIFLKKQRKKILALFAIPTIACMIIVGPIYNSCGIRSTEFTENIGIFIKQIYGTIYENLPIKEKDQQFLDGLVSKQEAISIYDPYSDHIKAQPTYSNDYLEKNKIDFFKTWLSIGLKYPTKYIDIYLKSTYGFWYPEAQGYIAHKWVIENNNYNLSSSQNFNNLKANEYFDSLYNMPIIKYLLSDAFCLWMLLISMTFIIIKKKYKYIIPLLLPITIWLTIMIATPLAYQPRYTFALYCVLPMTIFSGINIFQKKEK